MVFIDHRTVRTSTANGCKEAAIRRRQRNRSAAFCSACASKVADDSETDDDVVHGSASLQSYLSRDVVRLEKLLDCSQKELCSNLRHSGFKVVCFHRKSLSIVDAGCCHSHKLKFSDNSLRRIS